MNNKTHVAAPKTMPTEKPPQSPSRDLIIGAREMCKAGGMQAEKGALILYEALCPHFERTFNYKCQSKSIAEDIAIQAVLRVISQITKQHKDEAIEGWCWTVAWSVFNTQIKKENRNTETVRSVEPEHYESLMQALHDVSADHAAQHCLAKQTEYFCEVHPDHAIALEYQVVHGLTPAEVGDIIGRTYSATTTFLSQAKLKLAAYWAECRS